MKTDTINRLALVIGNSEYEEVGKLRNPCNDANDMAYCLIKLGFKVNKYLNLNQNDLNSKIIEFEKELNNYSTGLFYYAGHGMQINGKNYLVPIDCKISNEELTALSCFDMDNLFNGISMYKDKTNIIILDSCRTNPFSNKLRGTMQSGFAAVSNPPMGTIISFSTSPESTAADGENSNGLFTEVLKEYIFKPNLKIEEMFKMVRTKVIELSANSQVPWEHSSLTGDFYFLVKPQSRNNEISDMEIYNFIQERWKYYHKQELKDIKDIECLAYVDAYNRYKIPIIEILRCYSRVSYSKENRFFSDEDIDEININYLSAWGFRLKNFRWYYKDKYVRMGEPLPIPKEMQEIPPIKGQEILIEFDIEAKVNEGLLYFTSTVNLPNGTPFIYSLKRKDGSYFAQCNSKVIDNTVPSDGFSDKGQTLCDGVYTISLTSPIHSVQPKELKNIFGERNRNLIGKYVKYSPIGGNMIEYSKIITKDGNKILIF
ncbi:caspase family protein [Clostridium felsineum]|uniref:caspase family protein n=1 Tax=Clostridium felsineum TaxID=36839 RepID=UPI0009D55DB7|nr:caspase family protein [Clostridium felsineum]URZ16712.1 hypothetical protein CLFE_027590 [Clostridium felsineum DSM 794]